MADDLLADELTRRVGWVLVHSLWQLAAVAAAAWAALALLRSHPPAARYAVACFAMAAMGVPLAATFLAAGRDAGGVVAQPAVPVSAPRVVPPPGEHPSPDESKPTAPSLATVFAAASPYLGGLAALWLAGAGAASAWVFGGWVVAQRLLRSGTRVADVESHLTRLAEGMRVRRPVRLLESTRVEAPVTIGWWRPVILVPPGLLDGLPPAERYAVLAHELAHVRRRDYPVNLLQVAAEAVLFFHPAVWWLSRRVRAEREFCCDDLAVPACGGPVPYAKALAAVASSRAPVMAVAILGRSEGMIVHRVRRVLAPDQGRGAGRVGPAVSLGLLLSVVGSLALANPPVPVGKGDAKAPPPVPVGKGDAKVAPPEKAQQAVRHIFRPTTTGSGKTSWSGMFAPADRVKAGDKSLMMIVRAHRGDRWPVRIAGEKETLFQAELVDGDDKQVELKVIDGGKDRKVVLKLDKPEAVKVGGKEFVLSYGTTKVAGTGPEYVDDAVLIFTLKRD